MKFGRYCQGFEHGQDRNEWRRYGGVMGMPVERAANVDSMSNPDALKPFIDLAQELK